MKTITEETFCHDFDEIMDAVMLNKESFIITTSNGGDVLLIPYKKYQEFVNES
jgi:hypothetical protein